MAEKQETLIVSLPTPSRFTSSDFQMLFVNVSYQMPVNYWSVCSAIGGWEGKGIWIGAGGREMKQNTLRKE